MIKICFICLGNICRSPMAEYMMKNKLKEYHLENEFYITSKATSYEEEGNDIYLPAKKELERNNIPYSKHHARRIEKEDINNFDYFICMDDSNIYHAKKILGDNCNIRKLTSKDITDPWYSRDFEKAYKEIDLGLNNLIKELLKK